MLRCPEGKIFKTTSPKHACTGINAFWGNKSCIGALKQSMLRADNFHMDLIHYNNTNVTLLKFSINVNSHVISLFKINYILC